MKQAMDKVEIVDRNAAWKKKKKLKPIKKRVREAGMLIRFTFSCR